MGESAGALFTRGMPALIRSKRRDDAMRAP